MGTSTERGRSLTETLGDVVRLTEEREVGQGQREVRETPEMDTQNQKEDISRRQKQAGKGTEPVAGTEDEAERD